MLNGQRQNRISKLNTFKPYLEKHPLPTAIADPDETNRRGWSPQTTIRRDLPRLPLKASSGRRSAGLAQLTATGRARCTAWALHQLQPVGGMMAGWINVR